MRRIVIAAAMSLFLVSLAALASADTLVMRDGSRIEGTVPRAASTRRLEAPAGTELVRTVETIDSRRAGGRDR